MAITSVDKMKINKYLRETAIENIYYLDLCDVLGKKEKVTEVEFLEYFTEAVVNELHKNEKFNNKQMSKYIYLVACFIQWINDLSQKSKDQHLYEIKEETLDKIRSFKEFYDEYLKRNKLEMDQKFNDEFIEEVVSIVNKRYPCNVKRDSVSKYISQVRELEAQIKQLKIQLDNITRQYDSLNTSYEKKSSKLDIQNETVAKLEKDVRKKEKDIVNLNEQLESLSEKINNLELELSRITEENAELLPYKEQFEKMTLEIEMLKKQIEDENKIKKSTQSLKTKQSKIEALIYQKLLFESATIEEIIAYVKEQGFSSDRTEIASLLKKIRSKITIESSTFALSPSYKIITPSIKENGKLSLNIQKGCKHYDIMLVSDFHLKNIDKKVLTGFDILNNYCINNNINLILNLGDFYDCIGGKSLEYANSIKNYKLIEQSISQIPRADGIYHAILGGNHDRNIIKYGFDPIKILTDEREDFINLGYTHSTIELINSESIIGMFDIHHPESFDFSIHLDEEGLDTEYLEKYLKELYKKQNRNRDNSYIDIFGHTHKSQFNYPESYCYIPSYFEGQLKKGACHLRIYLNDDKDIKYMVFMPLSLNGELTKNNEIIYKKILSK